MPCRLVHSYALSIIKQQVAHRTDKLGIYKPLIRLVLSYGCEAWTVTQSTEEMLAILKRKILRIISGSVCENDLGWTPRHNEGLCELLDGSDTVKYVKLKRLQRAGHIDRMDNTRLPEKSTEWNI